MKHTTIVTTAIALCAFAACKRPADSQTRSSESSQTLGQYYQAETGSPAKIPPQTPATKKLEDMTAMEVAKDPAAHGFEEAGSVRFEPTGEDLRQGMKRSSTVQWVKKTPEGKIYLLDINYEDNKMVAAKWGGFAR